MQEHEVSVMVSNSRERTITFVLEPWGEIYTMEPRVRFTLLLRSSIQGAVEIDDGVDRMTMYAWEGCTAALFQDGEELGAGTSPRPRVPKIP
jgi:hypothetical protein